MDMTWVTGRIAVGGGIWGPENMAEVARAGVTHIIDMQIEFDDTPLAEKHGVQVLWIKFRILSKAKYKKLKIILPKHSPKNK